MLAIIGGSGLTDLANMDVKRREVVRTPYGEPSGALTFGHVGARDVVFIARHGYGLTIPPHLVNYRANIWALAQAGATGVVSVASVGGIRSGLGPGDILIPDQIVDYTWGRHSTFHDQTDRPVVHIDFTHPYDGPLRTSLLAAARLAGEPASDGGTYAACQGPRLETAAEINRLERDGADIVGMTGMPEASLAREAHLPYACIAVVANHAAGRGSSAEGIHLADVHRVVQTAMGRVRRILEHLCAETEE